eukprot:gb/GECG01006531.1/.p1 GENE.gb/GECG01006531.1/~~gb/GECG01006531.1/.p1  ORF type:complete len:208 (+),score=23.40 gb/GECG01006531.1/:1-624(+)
MSSTGESPQPPLRKKAQRACVPCARSKTKCDGERPCQRCERKGIQIECVDRPRTKRRRDVNAELVASGVSLPENTRGKDISLVDWMFERRPASETAASATTANDRELNAESELKVPSSSLSEADHILPTLPQPLQSTGLSNLDLLPAAAPQPTPEIFNPTIDEIIAMDSINPPSDLHGNSLATEAPGSVADLLLPLDEGRSPEAPEE